MGSSGVISGNDTFINDYNNVVGGYGGLDMVDPAIKGPNDIDPAILPDYLEPMADSYNFEYTNGTLLTGDEFGGPIGSFRYFGVPPAPTPTPIPSSSVGDWSLYR